ncbi:gas vesicle protein G [Mycobacterium colombiense]|uniref:Gas vesicle protein G n=1 Tax=Mycobacterium colombiense TaxID=339268 RepID=A0A853M858_9MYCO|nr:gas vesicle protein GvpG [Mycobacterium colombiense]OBJ08249.1 gas vesicle protein G [Mycobacterium colombiense]OBJ23911.1 gas vesicle protein G [Mycobacterium colombiense]OBJ28479.1 gas vesicle protein G [Mycobacterium colombiense]OBJ65135.1 gas vesicle protein G [Mycobacterium colombiense]OBJ80346.1 gas vesicle protein G [Mycobacterium colombiense]
MGFFSAIVLSPLAPVRGVMWLGNVIQRQVEQQLHDPANTRRQLEALQEARERGEITVEEEKQAQQQILQARMAPKST